MEVSSGKRRWVTDSDVEWRRMTESDEEWRRATKSNGEWREVTGSDGEWWRMADIERDQKVTVKENGSFISLKNDECDNAKK